MTALVSDTRRNAHDLDRLREEWRLKAREWAAAEDNASRLEEGRKMLMSGMRLELISAGMTIAKAEDSARTSEQFKGYVRKMHDARRLANDLKIEAENANRLYWEQVNSEANERSEKRMSR